MAYNIQPFQPSILMNLFVRHQPVSTSDFGFKLDFQWFYCDQQVTYNPSIRAVPCLSQFYSLGIHNTDCRDLIELRPGALSLGHSGSISYG